MSSTTLADPSLEIKSLRLDGGTQPRAEINIFAVQDYADAMREGATFPPVVVFYDGENYWLADGFHRVAAAQQAEKETIAAEVKHGSRRDAVLFSVGANSQHGLRRTNEDKRRSVITLIEDEEWSQWSDSEIAKRAAVDRKTVASLRGSLGKFPSERVYTDRYGNTSVMDTSNIGGPSKEIRKELDNFPTKHQETIYESARSLARSEGISLTPHIVRRAGEQITDATQMGYLDAGTGESNPVTESIRASNREARERQDDHKTDEAVKLAMVAAGNLKPREFKEPTLKLITIGYHHLSLMRFADELAEAGVSDLWDVREYPYSGKPEFRQGPLMQACNQLGVKYHHKPRLGVPSLLRALIQGMPDMFDEHNARVIYYWYLTEYNKRWQPVANIEELKEEVERNDCTALLCVEPEGEMCHRHFLAELLEFKVRDVA